MLNFGSSYLRRVHSDYFLKKGVANIVLLASLLLMSSIKTYEINSLNKIYFDYQGTRTF